jgi:hypothetical protein
MSTTQTVEEALVELLDDASTTDETVCGAYDITTDDGDRYEVEITRVVPE